MHAHTDTHTHTRTQTYTHTHSPSLSNCLSNTHTHTHTHTGAKVNRDMRRQLWSCDLVVLCLGAAGGGQGGSELTQESCGDVLRHLVPRATHLRQVGELPV